MKFANNCIHLKACRRLSKIAKSNGMFFSRNCTKDCSAYINGDLGSYVETDTAVEYARNGVSSIRSGYDTYDVYCSFDLYGQSIGEIIEEKYEEREKE